MNVSPTVRYYVRRLLAAHPAVQSRLQEQPPTTMESLEDHLESYVNLDYLTYPQLNELEFLIELHQKIKANEPHHTQYLKNIERKIFNLVGVDLSASSVSPDAVAELASFFSDREETESPAATLSAPTNAVTLRQYGQYFQLVTSITARYLGKMIVNNYWLLTRPRQGWLSQLRVDTFWDVNNFLQNLPIARTEMPLSEAEVETLDQWIHGFIRYACRVLPTLPRLLLAAGMPSHLLYDLVR
ncbi:hypothetical protein L5220_09350 [Synechococcus sp. PCC 6716]|nr:hypothetical protein [Synechococcus sp. PCC 6716]